MREDLQQLISTALDAPGGLDADASLRARLERDPEAAAYARDLQRLGAALRRWPLPVSDEALEAIAVRIEQRLDEVLPEIADPTAPPEFDDEDAFRDGTGGQFSDRAIAEASFGGLVLEERPEKRQSPAIPRVLAPAPPSSVSARPAAFSEQAATEDRSMVGAPDSARPRPTEIHPLQTVADGRTSIPSPSGGTLPRPDASSSESVRRLRRGIGWFAGLAAAAAVGMGVLVTTSLRPGVGLRELATDGAADLDRSRATPKARAVPHGIPAAASATGASASESDLETRLEGLPVPRPATSVVPELPGAAASGAGFAAQHPSRGSTAVGHEGTSSPAAEGQGSRAVDGWTIREGAGLPLGSREGAGFSLGSRARRIRSSDGSVSPLEVRRGRAAVRPAPTAPRLPRDTSSSTTEGQRLLPGASVSPGRAAVLSAVQGVEAAVRACGSDQHGVVTIRFVVAPSGRVTNATVIGPFAGTPTGNCVARVVRGARFPPFSGDRMAITYPFQL
jgi:hypothetical protein